MAKKTIFISHISTETEVAQCLKRQLETAFPHALHIFVSSDRKTIKAGDKWLLEVEKALTTADMQLVLCSKESVGRPWVNFEAGAVWLRGIPVIPVCHSGMKLTDLPVPLNMLQGIEGSQPAGLQQLHEAVAATFKFKPAKRDFGALAKEVKLLEERYEQARQETETIQNPRILCAASEQFAEPGYGFHLDVAVLEKTFPQLVTVEPKLTQRRLIDLLASQRFDIVHLVLAVNPENGELLFSPIDPRTHNPLSPNPDKMSPASFANLLVESHTRLVVLATCKALLLGVEVAHVANMAASDAFITGEEAAKWEESFYGYLAQGKSIHKAFDLMKLQTGAPIRPIRHQDVAFSLMNGPGESKSR